MVPGQTPRWSPPVVAALLLVMGLSGCFGDEEVTDPLLQESMVVGEPLFSWGEAVHFGPAPGADRRAVNASFEVTPDLWGVGVLFQGAFIWQNSTADLFLRDPSDEVILRLEAAEGFVDDEGTIGSTFTFQRAMQAEPGRWRVLAQGYGNLSSLEVRLHGIPAGDHEVERSFTVPTDDVDLRLAVHARGWGQAPEGELVGPDGSSTPLSFTSARSEAVHEWTAMKGDHELRFDTSGWGGRLIVEVVPV